MSLAAKLQAKGSVRVLNAPDGFRLDAPDGDDGVLLFVRDEAELRRLKDAALDAARADRLSWIAYPKGGQLGTDLNRDRLWALLKKEGVRPVRQVSVDDVWSALRFRPA